MLRPVENKRLHGSLAAFFFMTFPQEERHPLALCAMPDDPAAGGGPEREAEASAFAARLASAEQTLRDISHALAHDLRTSLRHVTSYAQLLGEPAHASQPEHVTRLSHKVLDASRHLQRLMESMAALARLQAADLQPERIDTTALLRSLVRELDERNAGQGQRVACVLAPGLPAVQADPLLLRRIWQELLDNAWRHARTNPQPRLEVWSEPVPGGHAFYVRDNGDGFEPERASDLFGLFRHDRSTPSPGLGVGLAMVRRAVECHGGRVCATARPGEGASFGFSLPRADA